MYYMPAEEIIALKEDLERLRSGPECSELVEALNKLAYAELHFDPEKSEALALEAQNLAKKQGILIEQARSFTTLGTLNLEAGNFAEAMSYCRKSMKTYEELGDKEGMASVHSTIAAAYKAQGMIDKALEHFHESLRQNQEIGADKDELARCHFNIGACYSAVQRLDLAQTSYEYTREIWEESGDRTKLAYLYHNIGSLFGKKEELDSAREYFQKALDIREDMGNKTGTASTLANLGIMHEKLNDIESALSCFSRSIELYKSVGNRRGVAYASSFIGATYTKLGRLDEAEEFIGKALEITRNLKLKDLEIHCLDKITDLYEAKGDLKKALMYSLERNTNLEEHMNEKSIEKIALLQVQFETEKKEREAEIYRLKNVDLSTKNDQLREAMAHVKKLQGMLPICAHCKKVRDDDGYWQQIESYISDHSGARFSHGICPECSVKLFGKGYIPKLS
ncbi:MAG: tetratricopeptide repeat protein [Candidatus Sabulitectum sp.]|nr:tetratricopeptide repeat protein [Candidatus Sabulitectum sp.]